MGELTNCVNMKIGSIKTLSDYFKVFKRRRTIFAAILMFILCLTVLHTDKSPDFYVVHWKQFENTSCHYSDLNDALPSIEECLHPPPSSIFFHETSCTGHLNSRQACAVESAARLHTKWQIYLLFSGPVTADNLDGKSLEVIRRFDNVNVARVHIVDYAKSTPLEDLINGGALNRSRWRISHTSDVLRYLTLYKWGGIYLDLDVVVARSLEDLAANWAARENDKTVAAGALAFSGDDIGRMVANAAISDLKAKYRGDEWARNGPGVITRVLHSLCATSDHTAMSTATCKGFEVYGPELFYPIVWYHARDYFATDILPVTDPYMYHVWNKLTHHIKVQKESVYSKLAERYCPETYKSYGDDFGL